MKLILIIPIILCFDAFGIGINNNDTLISNDFLKIDVLLKHSQSDSLMVDSSDVVLAYNPDNRELFGRSLAIYEVNKDERNLFTGLLRIVDSEKRFNELKLVINGFEFASIKYNSESNGNSNSLHIKQLSFYNYPLIRKILWSNLSELQSNLEGFNNLNSKNAVDLHKSLYNLFIEQNKEREELVIFYHLDFRNNELVIEKKATVDLSFYKLSNELNNNIKSYGRVSSTQIENYKKISQYELYSIKKNKTGKICRKLNKYFYKQFSTKTKIKKSNINSFILTNKGLLKINSQGIYNEESPKDQYKFSKNYLKLTKYLTETKQDTVKILTGLDYHYFESQEKLNSLDFQDFLEIQIQIQIDNSVRNNNQKSFLFWKLSCQGILRGSCGELNVNKELLWKGNYKKGEMVGKWISYDPLNGLIKGIRTYTLEEKYSEYGTCSVFNEIPNMDILNKSFLNSKILTNCYFSGEKEEFVISSFPIVFEKSINVKEKIHIETDAEYPGGYSAMMNYIQNNLNYPPSAIELGIQGKVTLKFVVEQNGQISNVSVIKGIPGCAECDKEAIKAVSNMPRWTPAVGCGGKQLRQWNTMPISFSLE
jgi:TonB family protein